jgi:hypothetical protein
MSSKTKRGGQAASSGYWQNQRYYLTDEYKAAQREIIVTHKKLSPRAMKAGLVILGRFKHTPKIHTNLEKLAAECGMHRETLRKYMAELAKRKVFHFRVPDFNSRGAAKATEIRFPTFNVRKWLRHSDNLKSMAKNSPAKNPPPYQEVCASPARDAAAAAHASASRQQENNSGNKTQLLGVLYDDNGDKEWFPATTARPAAGLPGVGTVMTFSDGERCTIMGYSMNAATQGRVLVDLNDDPGEPFWQEIETLTLEAEDAGHEDELADDFEDEDEPAPAKPAAQAKPTKPIPPKGAIVATLEGGRFTVGQPLANGLVKIHGDGFWMEAHPNSLRVIALPRTAA